jgi:hypothetical protein
MLTWIHAGEAVFTLLALSIVDVTTAPSNDRRTLAFVAVSFAISMLPVVVTNVLISGDPLAPPRMLTPADISSTSPEVAGGISGRFSGGAAGEVFLVGPLLRLALVVGTQILEGIAATLEVDRFVQTWLRSGSNEFLQRGRGAFAGSNLTVLESVPLFGAFTAVVAGAVNRVFGAGSGLGAVLDRIDPTDLLAATITIAFVLLYAKRLPVHVQITIRYLLPTYPLLLYLLLRQPLVSTLLATRGRLVGWTYAAGVLLGTQLLLVYVVVRALPVAAAVQVHALLALAIAAFLGIAVVATAVEERADPVAAIALGLAGAAGTAFLLLTGLAYFSFVGEHVLPVADAISDVVGRI